MSNVKIVTNTKARLTTIAALGTEKRPPQYRVLPGTSELVDFDNLDPTVIKWVDAKVEAGELTVADMTAKTKAATKAE